ncbi:nuclear receptor subfamily 0 group B member 1-like [Anneissia japonica]|uniref:nuclear receptor subfamily 0 group B member 1-like n=1 Tax=Anneissia japonica TaxID=1529436 RepID=UPI001425630F|nr:nuclear receptor subfamily 0 group B member 1-like [Anneissia japonica]
MPSSPPKCACPEQPKENSILFSLLSTPPTEDHSSKETSVAYPTTQLVDSILKRTSRLQPPVVVALRYPELVCQQAAQLLLKIVDFVKALPSCSCLSSNDRALLLKHCWAELLLISMTKYRFRFEIIEYMLCCGCANTTNSCCEMSNESVVMKCLAALQGIPTKSDIQLMDSFFTRCETMELDDKEYAFLQSAILFNPDVPGLENPMLVERLQSSVQLHLNEYVAAKHPYDQLRFARILLSLPPLRNIKAQVVTQLFFRDIIGNVAMEDLLTQMLQG